MMKTAIILISCLLLTDQRVFAADADLSAAVKAAARALADQPSYRWKTSVRAEGSGPFGGNSATSGQVEKDGYTWVSSTSPNSSLEFARKADKTAVLLDGNWMTLDQAVARSPGRRRRSFWRWRLQSRRRDRLQNAGCPS
jgi:hypothetical protein